MLWWTKISENILCYFIYSIFKFIINLLIYHLLFINLLFINCIIALLYDNIPSVCWILCCVCVCTRNTPLKYIYKMGIYITEHGKQQCTFATKQQQQTLLWESLWAAWIVRWKCGGNGPGRTHFQHTQLWLLGHEPNVRFLLSTYAAHGAGALSTSRETQKRLPQARLPCLPFGSSTWHWRIWDHRLMLPVL